jgi:ankyrin repeat protein
MSLLNAIKNELGDDHIFDKKWPADAFNAVDEAGATPLALAVLAGRWKLVFWLKTMGVNARSVTGTAALLLAAHDGDHRTVRDMITAGGIDLGAANARGETAMGMAIYSDNLRIIDHLIGAGVSVNAPCDEFETPPLLSAVQRNSISMVDRFIYARADVNAYNVRGVTPLMAAAWRGALTMVESLLKVRADVNASDGAGNTALLGVGSLNPYSTDGHIIVDLLLKAGARVNVVNRAGDTCLIKYVRKNVKTAEQKDDQFLAIQRLIQSGADVSAVSGGKTALQWATLLGLPAPILTMLASKPGQVVGICPDCNRPRRPMKSLE